ncbi:potassium-transporting ATPase subunit F [Govanella unica]|uniref:Potassium-transporting ATPase subunit F n=1 Tax=Govanella unica TaxID=2975056 RepID=A0A9X3TZ21_9PROT|nr:potassium-transporting ATPase subunit F [Govania unica]MDA5194411.1 potassium-transporting ATPase subunit F [Govania unica]
MTLDIVLGGLTAVGLFIFLIYVLVRAENL